MMDKRVEFAHPRVRPASGRRLLLVFDGGDAPGYASVAVALTEEGTRRGYEVWAAAEGFRSLTRDFASEPQFERLIVGRQDRYALLSQGIPARSMGRRVLDAGSDFRSERYQGFLERELGGAKRPRPFARKGSPTWPASEATARSREPRPSSTSSPSDLPRPSSTSRSTTTSRATAPSASSRGWRRGPRSPGACRRTRIPTSACTSSR